MSIPLSTNALSKVAPTGSKPVQNATKTGASSVSLGKRSVEGVEAEGTRTTSVIPTGAIGNDRPIEIVSERWYSPELQITVMTRHFDPRLGESTFRLVDIRRGEPGQNLFEVPAGYQVRDKSTR